MNLLTAGGPGTDLNERQRCAVEHDGGHLLVVAGPGTGKTRTLVSRIARLAAGLPPESKVLAVTFTNKAADEMRDRLAALDAGLLSGVFAGTFHSFALSLLREHAGRLPFPLDFTIITPDEAEELAAGFLPEASRRERRDLLEAVAGWKASLQETSPDRRVEAFRAFLRERALVDFDDILRDAVILLRDDPAAARAVRRQYPFVMVDEYQDVNLMQVELLKLLAADGVHLTVIGDPNQSIYGFRGSEARFFERFAADFAPCRRIELGENYRSAAKLLEASGQVIRGGARFPVPELTARIHAGGFLGIHEAAGEKAEAAFVAREIGKLIGGAGHHDHDINGAGDGGGYSFSDIAVLFRLNAQAGALEEALGGAGIPFQTAGVRPAGLSLTTRQGLKEVRDVTGLPSALERSRARDEALSANWERVLALARGAASVTDFLDRLSLDTPEDAYNARAEKVALLTLHAAKGLEFPVVFIAGCEEGLLPLEVDFLKTDIGEERRLFYVGMTRARERLYFVRARRRTLFGLTAERPLSSFLADIQEGLEAFRARAISRRRAQEREQMKLF